MILFSTVRKSLALGACVAAAVWAAAGCSQKPPPSPNPANDPANMGSPQKRLEELKANNMMNPRLKARKMRILEDEINGTHTAAPGQH